MPTPGSARFTCIAMEERSQGKGISDRLDKVVADCERDPPATVCETIQQALTYQSIL